MTTWVTQKNEEIELEEMTDLHLQNSIRYCRRNNSTTSLYLLLDELKRREVVRFNSQTRRCHYCSKPMKLQSHTPIEVGLQATTYRFECKCGACSCSSTNPDLIPEL